MAITTRTLDYSGDGETFEGYLALPEGAPKPVVLVAHAWGGQSDMERGKADRIAAELGYAAFAGVPLISSAVGGQAALKKYANYFSTLTYRKIREGRFGHLDDEEVLETLCADNEASLDMFFLSNALYDQHLKRIYAPKEHRRFTPRYLCSAEEEARLAKRYYGAENARYIF